LKPDNIMVADDGRVRVMDFGLARAEDVVRSSERAIVESSGASKPLALHEDLTVDGALVGTPAYMAPEHLAGLRNDAKSDQFSFCVAFWEALHGQRPFAGSSLPELAANILDGHVREPADLQRAPAWLRSIVVRGMATDPLQRWPSMLELVQALERGDARARRRIAFLGVGALALLGAGAFGWHVLDRRARISACAAEGAAIAEVWNDETRAQIRGAMIATGVGNAEVTADKALPWIEARVAGWQSARTNVCTAAEVDATLDRDGLDRARWCFDERRMQLEALVGQWRAPSSATIQLAVEAASGLPDAHACSDAALLARLPLPPPDTRAAIQAVQAELAHAAALELAGDYEGGRRIAEPALARADGSSWPPLSAAAHHRMGALLDELGHHADAERELDLAYFEATRAGAIGVAADAAIQQIYVVGHRLARHDDALLWSRMATLAVDQLGDDAPRRAMLAAYTALVHDAAGQHDRALELYQAALALRETAYGPEHPAVPATLTMIAGVYYSTGRFTEAEPLYRRGLVELE
ncbi:MAG TPA: tetratricopeptide repeat-containing protein kinase family protein, partial [Nannocystaceae bacterium]|nr:tetratricopeptide repeat-containing protein kinase family protein [Nannocystaceae bacterium]